MFERIEVSFVAFSAFLLLIDAKIVTNIGDLAVSQKSCINLVALPHNIPHKSKPCPPFNGFNLDSKDIGS